MFRPFNKMPEKSARTERMSLADLYTASNMSMPVGGPGFPDTIGDSPNETFPLGSKLIILGEATREHPYVGSREQFEQKLYEEFRGFIHRELLK
jgi:hypothetical protein